MVAIINGDMTLLVSDPEQFVMDPNVSTALVQCVSEWMDVANGSVTVELSLQNGSSSFQRRLQDPVVQLSYSNKLPASANTTAIIEAMVLVSPAEMSERIIVSLDQFVGDSAYTVLVTYMAEPNVTYISEEDTADEPLEVYYVDQSNSFSAAGISWSPRGVLGLWAVVGFHLFVAALVGERGHKFLQDIAKRRSAKDEQDLLRNVDVDPVGFHDMFEAGCRHNKHWCVPCFLWLMTVLLN
jgi:hypothetical protein